MLELRRQRRIHGRNIGESESRTPRMRIERRQLHGRRSEEHTSELQSLRHLVCRLLLEKKKNSSAMHANNHVDKAKIPEQSMSPITADDPIAQTMRLMPGSSWKQILMPTEHH